MEPNVPPLMQAPMSCFKVKGGQGPCGLRQPWQRTGSEYHLQPSETLTCVCLLCHCTALSFTNPPPRSWSSLGSVSFSSTLFSLLYPVPLILIELVINSVEVLMCHYIISLCTVPSNFPIHTSALSVSPPHRATLVFVFLAKLRHKISVMYTHLSAGGDFQIQCVIRDMRGLCSICSLI